MRPDAKVNLGVIQVHKNVIADICSVAISEVDGAGTASGSHPYATAGSYTITITVKDGSGTRDVQVTLAADTRTG